MDQQQALSVEQLVHCHLNQGIDLQVISKGNFVDKWVHASGAGLG